MNYEALPRQVNFLCDEAGDCSQGPGCKRRWLKVVVGTGEKLLDAALTVITGGLVK